MTQEYDTRVLRYQRMFAEYQSRYYKREGPTLSRPLCETEMLKYHNMRTVTKDIDPIGVMTAGKLKKYNGTQHHCQHVSPLGEAHRLPRTQPRAEA